MIEWFAYAQIIVAAVAGLLCLVLGVAGKIPGDLAMGAIALVELLLVAQLITAIVAPATGNSATGNVAEFYTYLISAMVIPLATGLWGLIERSRWSTLVMGVGALAVAVMLYRMLQIWTIQQG